MHKNINLRSFIVRTSVCFILHGSFAITGYGQIVTTGVLSQATNSYSTGMGTSSTASIKPASLGYYDVDYNALGDIVWTVSWRAPAGYCFKLDVPPGWDSATFTAEFQAGFSGGVSHWDTSPSLAILDENGDMLGNYNSGAYMMVRPTAANTVNAWGTWTLTPGNTYYFSAIELSTTVPAAINETITNVVTAFQLLGNLSSSGTPPDPGQWFSLAPTDPQIVIEQPAGTAWGNGSYTSVFYAVENVSSLSNTQSFLIINANPAGAILTNITAGITGAGATNFSITTALPASVAPGATNVFSVTYRPAAAGTQLAVLDITSNDPDSNPFIITLSGNTVTLTNDVDSDGLSDGAEVLMQDLGFDLLVSQPLLVNTFTSYTAAAGLYTLQEIADLRTGSVMFGVTNDEAHITLAFDQSTNLIDWVTVTNSSTATIPTGGANVKFFRLGVE